MSKNKAPGRILAQNYLSTMKVTTRLKTKKKKKKQKKKTREEKKVENIGIGNSNEQLM